MKISDKELDDLFSSKLNDLELEPNDMVWNNISDQINNNKTKKKSIVPVLRIAAGLIVVISIGLLLFNNEDPIIKKPVQNKVAKVETEQQKPAVEPTENVKSDKLMLLLSAKNKVVKEVRQNKISNKKRVIILVPKITPELKIVDEMLAANIQPEKKNDPNMTVLTAARTTIVPDVSTRFNNQTDDEEIIAATVKPQNLRAKNSIVAVVAKRKGIRSIGDVVNLVMAKVDKRQDKLIEFSDSDDGEESNVTGINLGIISIKKEKSKL